MQFYSGNFLDGTISGEKQFHSGEIEAQLRKLIHDAKRIVEPLPRTLKPDLCKLTGNLRNGSICNFDRKKTTICAEEQPFSTLPSY